MSDLPRWDVWRVRNRVTGIIPTFGDFDVNPSNPERITDRDFTTETGEGIKSLGSPGVIGHIKFDMGSAYPVLVVAHINAHRDSGDGTINAIVQRSDDGISYSDSGYLSLYLRYVDTYHAWNPTFLYARYFRIRIWSSGQTIPSVYHVKIVEIQALQII